MKSCSVKPIEISNKFLTNAILYTLSIPIKHALQTHTHTHTHEKSLLLFLVLSLLISSFRPLVPDLNLNKRLEPMSEIPCKYFLHSKFYFNSLYSLNLLFLHIPECKLLLTKFQNALLFIQDTASLEPSEVEVRSISLIISKTLVLIPSPSG